MSTVTLKDIAKHVGVSHVTVSHALRGTSVVKKETRHRVEQAARQLGYRPSIAARAIRTGRTGFIGMIRSSLATRSVHASDFDTALDLALHRHDLCLIRDIIEDDATQAPRIVRENAVDQLIINYAFNIPAPIRQLLDRCQIPAVWINHDRDANCVRPADIGAARNATEYLLGLGHRKIAFVRRELPQSSVVTEEHYSCADREAGYCMAMTEAGLTPRSDVLPRGALQRSQTLRCYTQWLRLPDRPTAVICYDAGRIMLHAAALLGIRVPQDLSVISFDNEAAASLDLEIDRMLVRYGSMAAATVDELLALAHQPRVQRKPVFIPFEFRHGWTTASVSN